MDDLLGVGDVGNLRWLWAMLEKKFTLKGKLLEKEGSLEFLGGGSPWMSQATDGLGIPSKPGF